MSQGIDYGEYLSRVESQRQRDEDRYRGRDSHSDLPAYDMRDGKQLHGGRAVMFIELDPEGWPIIRAYHAPTREAQWALSRAASAVNLSAAIRRSPQEQATSMEMGHRKMVEDEEKKRAQHLMDHPFVCALDGCSQRFKTARGLEAHQQRSQWHRRKQATR